ncbi:MULTISPECIES: molybdenum cofactor biosynthesis protein MoaE [Alcanivorax]|nr:MULTISPECIES: molybdenum cofactor biosynthesis protein MoaE [Alcanivorax]
MTDSSNRTHLTEQPIAIDALLALDQYPECGGLALFAGTVRDHHQGLPVESLRYTAYVPLAEKRIAEIEQQARERFGLSYCRVVHRLGALRIGDVAIVCVARAAHRAEAFEACRYLVDEVKHQAPIWKEEFYTDGSSAYVQGCCIRPDTHSDAHSDNQRDVHPDHHRVHHCDGDHS